MIERGIEGAREREERALDNIDCNYLFPCSRPQAQAHAPYGHRPKRLTTSRSTTRRTGSGERWGEGWQHRQVSAGQPRTKRARTLEVPR